jgi:hypothetical protein
MIASAIWAQNMHTREEHAAILESHAGEKGLLRHRYRRCGFSGAGNCCCGRALESTLHPHPFTLSRSAREKDQWRCVCSKAQDHDCHQEANR